DTIYVHGSIELLVLLDIPNLNPYVAFDSGADDYIAAGKPNGFASIIQEIEARPPRVAVLTRLANVHHADDLMRWVNQHYQRLQQFNYAPLWVRTEAPASTQ